MFDCPWLLCASPDGRCHFVFHINWVNFLALCTYCRGSPFSAFNRTEQLFGIKPFWSGGTKTVLRWNSENRLLAIQICSIVDESQTFNTYLRNILRVFPAELWNKPDRITSGVEDIIRYMFFNIHLAKGKKYSFILKGTAFWVCFFFSCQFWFFPLSVFRY